MMNILDFIIIYLACGAPFGVYFYFQQRETENLWQNSPKVWLNCVIITLFWLPFALQLLTRFVTTRLRNNEFAVNYQTDSNQIKEIERLEKELIQILQGSKSSISLYEFRQTFDRYTGLTLNNLPETNNQNFGEFELYKITNHENPKLATICLQRRNRLHLKDHQINARNEILRIFEILKQESDSITNFSALTLEFAKILRDSELESRLNQLFDFSMQNKSNISVNSVESELWKIQKQKPQPITQPTLNLPMQPTPMMSKHD